MHTNDPLSGFLDHFQSAFAEGQLVKMTLGKPPKAKSELKNVYVRPVAIKMQLMLSFVYRYETRDVTVNFNVDEATEQLKTLLGREFLHAIIFTVHHDLQLAFNKKRVPRLIVSEATQSLLQDVSHDREKHRLIKTEGNIWLQQLGITNKNFEVVPKMQDKFRQINKYVELIDAMIDENKSGKIFRVADMGSGKGYLTFSLYDHLVNNRKMDVRITGVEMRDDLVIKCNRIAKEAGFDHLHFVKSNIADFDASEPDMLIALHACDTATDDAIFRGITGQAGYIVVAPCCHKQVRKAMQPPDELKPMLKHGIFAGRQAELITDALRALIMERYGYKTKVFEFISTEHTPKNIMIAGVKTSENVDKVTISKQIHKIKILYGIEKHHLEELLAGYEHIVKNENESS
jgi:hypothetical protein